MGVKKFAEKFVKRHAIHNNGSIGNNKFCLKSIAVVWRLIFTDDHSMFVDYPNGGRPIEVDVVKGIRNVLLHIVFVAIELPKTLSFVMHLEKHVQAALDLRIY